MIYSIRGTINTSDSSNIINVINQYQQWKPCQSNIEDAVFSFEAWVVTMDDKDSLFNELKTFVDIYTGLIDWHECCHDEPPEMQHPCIITEEYRR